MEDNGCGLRATVLGMASEAGGATGLRDKVWTSFLSGLPKSALPWAWPMGRTPRALCRTPRTR